MKHRRWYRLMAAAAVSALMLSGMTSASETESEQAQENPELVKHMVGRSVELLHRFLRMPNARAKANLRSHITCVLPTRT